MLRGTGPRAQAPEPLRVALLCSRRAPGLAHLLERDRNRGRLYELVACVTSDPECTELARLDAARIHTIVHDLRGFYAARSARLSDLRHRPDYDRVTADLVGRYRPDLVVACGYLHIVTEPMLDAYPGRLANIHDSDLAATGVDGRPRYRGLRSTRDAVFAGERETRSTVHLMTNEVDVGPPLVRSWAFPTHPLVHDARMWGAADILKAYAYAQREWMMRAAWGPLLARAIELFALGQVRVRGDRVIIGSSLGPEELRPELDPELALLTGVGD